MLKRLGFVVLLCTLTGCGRLEQNENTLPINSELEKSESAHLSENSGENSGVDGFLLESYDVEGNPIREVIKITNVYHKIPDFVASNRTPTEGTHFECIEYKLNHSPMEEFYYVNVYVCDIDGQQLLYKDKEYSRRTYDYFDLITENHEKIYCYYEIPDGLKEYSLEFVNQIEPNSNRLHLIIKE